MFIVHLKTYLERWMKLSETPQTYDGLRDLFIREQFLDVSPVDLSTYLRERKLPTLDEVAQSADLFLTARTQETVKEAVTDLKFGDGLSTEPRLFYAVPFSSAGPLTRTGISACILH